MSDLFQTPDNFSRSTPTIRGPGNKSPKRSRRSGRGESPPKPPQPPSNDELVTIHLRHPHKINGEGYVGTVTVPRGMAAILLEGDQHVDEERANFLRSDKACLVGPRTPTGYKIIELPGDYYSQFDQVLGQAPVIHTQSGKGMVDPGSGNKF